MIFLKKKYGILLSNLKYFEIYFCETSTTVLFNLSHLDVKEVALQTSYQKRFNLIILAYLVEEG